MQHETSEVMKGPLCVAPTARLPLSLSAISGVSHWQTEDEDVCCENSRFTRCHSLVFGDWVIVEAMPFQDGGVLGQVGLSALSACVPMGGGLFAPRALVLLRGDHFVCARQLKGQKWILFDDDKGATPLLFRDLDASSVVLLALERVHGVEGEPAASLATNRCRLVGSGRHPRTIPLEVAVEVVETRSARKGN